MNLPPDSHVDRLIGLGKVPVQIAVVLAAVSLAGGLASLLAADHYDDAFITYVFARNLAAGHGMAWVPGDPPVLGSTSIGFTAVLALAARLDFDIQTTSTILGALGWAAATGLLFLLLRRQSTVAALGGSMLMAVLPLSAELSMGMESGIFTALVFAALLLWQEGRPRSASMLAATAVAIRPDGALLFALLFLEGLLANAVSLGARIRRAVEMIAPGLCALAALFALELAIFGTIVPESVRAKSRFGCGVSGCFSPIAMTSVVAQHIGSWPARLLFGGALLGFGRAMASSEMRRHLLVRWALLTAGSFMIGRAPDSPWYYAPLVPVLLAAYAYGLGASAGHARWRLPVMAGRGLLTVTIAVAILGTATKIQADPFGRGQRWNEERRRLAQVVLDDMARRTVSRADILAFEVGYLGFAVPGRVIDMLGIVTPGFAPCLQGENGDVALRRLAPDYVVVVDLKAYSATSCLYGAVVRSGRYDTIATLPRAWGHNYLVFARSSGR